MPKDGVEVRCCPCGWFFVGNHGCPRCGAMHLQTQLVLRVETRKLARIIADGLRSRPDAVEWYKERYQESARTKR